MSVASMFLMEDQFQCCICLDVFVDPTTIPCGHNFCKSCITQHWNTNSSYCCPLCKKRFPVRPELTVNTFIAGMATDFKQAVRRRGSAVARLGEVACDVCTVTKQKAVKSCLTCMASYCGPHLDPHQTSERLKAHQLIDPVDNMEGRVCASHKRLLELFCRTDQTCVCSRCMIESHELHDVISLSDMVTAKRVELQRMEAEVQEMIQLRELKSQQMTQLKKYSKDDAEREIASGVRIFTIFMQTAEQSLNRLIETIEERQRWAEQETDAYITELRQEVFTLIERSQNLQQITNTQDHFYLLQRFSSITPATNSRNWAEVRCAPLSYENVVVGATEELEKLLSKEKKLLLCQAPLRGAQNYAVDLLLDPQTANPWLVLSDDGKQIRCGEVRRDLPDNAERFSLYSSVLARQTFTSGRFYYEVQVSEKTDWTLGVVRSSVDRKGMVPLSPVHGYWAVGLRNGNQYLSLESPVVSLSLKSGLQRVGVFVGYEERVVSFYDVDRATHLYSFTNCSFSEELCPFFSPGLHHGGANSAPLVISPVRCTDDSSP